MIPRGKCVQQSSNCCQSGGKCITSFTTFEVRYTTLVSHACRILRTTVFIAFVYPGAILNIGRCRIDRRHDRTRRRIRRLTSVNSARCKSVAVFIVTGHIRLSESNSSFALNKAFKEIWNRSICCASMAEQTSGLSALNNSTGLYV